ncbi:DUF5610 domain-containing protein [Comamonas sp. CMM02]|uniref:DUF5610 domain-containing protein n=1 Tax=Comamonas sp. CMM02 TaxID=2769307 RepID=UPI0017865D48|nr:DUF5610 domain-containing protein [Comamonas sp. CMM02]MBD9401801.1 DUF5610 domain-containing protein [Comamonas sp. CMM02]
MISAPQATNAPVAADPAYTGTKSSQALEEAQKTAAASSQGQQNLRNSRILQASLQVSIQAGNDSLALLYRTAVDEIDNVLAPELGPNAIQNAMSQDNSAQATAGRIVGLSTAMFNAYAARYPDKDMEVVAQDFVNVVRGGFEQGYKEAEDILNSLGVLSAGSPVAEGISQTFALVQKGYDDWLASKLASLRSDEAQA